MPGPSLHPLFFDLAAADAASECARDATRKLTGGSPDDTLIARYEYDGLNRRIAKEVYAGGSLDHTSDMYYNENWQILEVRKDGNANPLKQYVWHTTSGGYVDAPAIRYYDPDTDGSSIATQYFTHDANMNVTALLDDTGAVIERYDYTPYGQVTFLTPDFTSKSSSAYEQDVLFAGYQYDAESGMYHVRHRSYDPMLGRWVQRDNFNENRTGGGYQNGMSLYEYVGSNPTKRTDSSGQAWYGNFCGPGGGGVPVDAVDTCCQAHDICYAGCGFAGVWGAVGPNACARACDRALCGCLWNANCAWGIKCNCARTAIMKVFSCFPASLLPGPGTGGGWRPV